MDVAAFCRKSRVLVVAGKGGVGKTTITAALARMAAQAGLSVLVVELEGKPGLAAAFGRPGQLGYQPSALTTAWGGDGRNDTRHARRGLDGRDGSRAEAAPGTVRARRITPDDALLEYLADHGMKRISKRLVSSGALDVVATAIPGIRDILVLGKVKSLERERSADLILVDAPATGHAMTFLSSAQGLLDAARSGPVRTQAADVVDMLSDPERCQVTLVTLPEEMPVNEVVEAAYALEDRIGVSLGPVIVNSCLPADPRLDGDPLEAAAEMGLTLNIDQATALGAAAVFRRRRYELQEEQRARLATELPLPQLQSPFLFSASIGPEEVDRLAADLAEAVHQLPDENGSTRSPRPERAEVLGTQAGSVASDGETAP
jgi:anion-transporting  ArsA/GET3 family ATPase